MEILSPASNLEHIQVAIDGKANAVYGGLKKWNARNKAINFSEEEYNFLLKELHKHNIKFFLTLNILMLDEEIDEVISFLKRNPLPDSFIVTDIGLILKLKEEFPNVPLHFSTQFGCHNIDDINFVESIGGERAILARELTLPEVKKIMSNTNIELECFIWGSQCLSFSGLCFFGTLINGGGGNRGKCIITCRDVYSINNEKGHYLYVPDMDCTNLISKLDGIDCLKLEGRRRKSQEIKAILDNIINDIKSSKETGYLYGKSVNQNHLYEQINSRTKPVMLASKLNNISDEDICIEYYDGKPIAFSKDYNNKNVYYIYTEIKKDFNINKKNLWLDLDFNKDTLNEVIYVNYKGDGHTFKDDNESKNHIILDLHELILDIEKKNPEINIYKIKYQKNNYDKLYVSKTMYNEIVRYILDDCKQKNIERKEHDFKLNTIYIETNDIKVVDELVNDEFVKIIYNIETVNNLKNIKDIVERYKDKIIYKLPLFNWDSENLLPYFELLSDMEVMFTRFSQIELTKNVRFKKKYTDYTIYVWNQKTLSYLKNNGITEFTSSPELSYFRNQKIFDDNIKQVILCGKLPLVYTRNCFGHIYGCSNCKLSQHNVKQIKNEDKNLDFEILCNDDYRYILNKNPILNNYTTINIDKYTNYRYVATGQDMETIITTIDMLKKSNYYEELKEIDYYKNSYECNLIEGKE